MFHCIHQQIASMSPVIDCEAEEIKSLGWYRNEAEFIKEYMKDKGMIINLDLWNVGKLEDYLDFQAIADNAFIDIFEAEPAGGGIQVYYRL